MAFNLDSKYTSNDGEFVLSGIQAIVKLAFIQKFIDEKRGLDTAGYITGYRGSPLGGLDKEFISQSQLLTSNDIKFKSAVNEDLAVAALQGTQQLGILSPAKKDGIFGYWYGKAPGVDRSGDVFRHSSFFGTTKHGGVVAFAGDDHANKSSTMASETGPTFATWYIPVLTPATIDDIIRLGMLGMELSRYSGLFVAVKIITNLADEYQTINVNIDDWLPVTPEKTFDVSARWPEDIVAENRIFDHKLPAIQEFLKHNRINEITHEAPFGKKKLGIVAVGKSWVDTLTAFQKHNIAPEEIGVSILKIGMAWPLQEELLVDFCSGHKEILVIEEKSGLVENQLYKLLYKSTPKPSSISCIPEIHGKDLLTPCLDFDGYEIAKAISTLIDINFVNDYDVIPQLEGRDPFFCSGCPHNTSTTVPEGSKALIGIGCHYIAQLMPSRPTETLAPMGYEGTSWIGQHEHQEADHIFVNLGDGTYFHSGILAIRQALASDANMTYKILFNDAVAMTGGQKMDGNLTVPIMCRQVLAEGATDVTVVSSDYKNIKGRIPQGVKLFPKEQFEEVQLALSKTKGVTILIYDQQCATEKRREVKRGIQEAPDERVWINPDICENCGDCSTASNCLSVVPVETALGTKRQIDQDSCNYSYDCLKGFCPSFITVKGKRVSKPIVNVNLPDVKKGNNLGKWKFRTGDRYNIVLAGIGGTGIVSMSQMLSVAAHIDGMRIVATDQTGLAQKYGAVTSMLSFGKEAYGRMYPGTADLVIGTDPQVTSSVNVMRYVSKDTITMLNLKASTSGQIIDDRDWEFDVEAAEKLLKKHSKKVQSFNATDYAKKSTGYSLMVNMLMLGHAYEQGLLPVREESMMQAIEANGTMVDANKKAWQVGRSLATKKGKKLIDDEINKRRTDIPSKFNDKLFYRRQLLDEYQNRKYGLKYYTLVNKAKACDKKGEFADAVMLNLYKLMAYKDEYEVARIWDSTLSKFNGDFYEIKGINFHLSMPWHRKSKQKSILPGYTKYFLKILKYGKKLRGTRFDLLGYSKERKLERKIRDFYIAKVEEWCSELNSDNYDEIVALAKQPDEIRGYAHIKIESIKKCSLFDGLC